VNGAHIIDLRSPCQRVDQRLLIVCWQNRQSDVFGSGMHRHGAGIPL